MAAVDERIREEREILERLMRSMKEGNEAEDEYRERRKDRWRVEKSLEALGDEKKVLEQRCKALTADPGCDGGTSTCDAELSRMDRNLQLFLSGACSPTRTGFRHVSRRPSGRHRNHLSVPNMRTRRMTVTGAQPMKLRRLSVEDTFAEVLKAYAKRNSKSVKLEPGQEFQAPSPNTPDASRSIIRQSLPESITSKTPSLTSVMEDDELVDRKPDPDSSHDLDFDDDSPISPDTGTALIFRHHLSSRDVDDDDIEFELPAYAKDLVTQFDRNRGTVDVGLAIQSRETPLPPANTIRLLSEPLVNIATSHKAPVLRNNWDMGCSCPVPRLLFRMARVHRQYLGLFLSLNRWRLGHRKARVMTYEYQIETPRRPRLWGTG
ncbi:hypothetical protein AAF712_012819 [Marasmius tenuissimus]|uniref:Uncharacterized protein n=1 Tax=Marasmius tenuissimus TaxID=585030 RepID=A0ABR2ZGA7_9AGAR